jgi:bacillopeptidase F
VCYYAQGFAQISNDGKWALFSSYWDGQLGADTAFGCSSRIDTFIVALVPPDSSSSSTSTTVTRIEQNGTGVAYAGTWYPNSGTFNSGGSAELAQDSGSRATFTFTGMSVSWVAYRDQWSGIARVYVDGVLKGTVDTYSATAQAQAVAYSVSGLTWGIHTLAIEATGTKSSPSSAAWVWVDAFKYVGAALQ